MTVRTSRQQAQFDSYRAARAREDRLLRQLARRAFFKSLLFATIGLVVIAAAGAVLGSVALDALQHVAGRVG